ncbi:MAG: hypothetical protein SFU99_21560 [Saprospiraceae bacterium]|nr:hypothetical protein [Saprospiraceae bacterium]
MKLDQELELMAKCYDLLKGLDADSKVRTLLWLSSKLHVGQATLVLGTDVMATEAGGGEATPEAPSAKPKPSSDAAAGGIESYNSLTDLVKVLKPSSDSEKALVSAVFLQLKRDASELTSAQVQKELKKIGQKVSNITQAISALVKKKYMIQISKEGNSQQARKKYKVTHEGIKTIMESMKK